MYKKGRYKLYFSGKDMCMSVLDSPEQDLVINIKASDSLFTMLYFILTHTDKPNLAKIYAEDAAPKQSLW